MLYNLLENRVKKATDCISCPYFDKTTKACGGINKNCYLYDEKTKTVIDGVTGLPLKIKKSKRSI